MKRLMPSDNVYTQSELIELVSPQATHLGIHFIMFLSQFTVTDAPPFEGPV